MPIVGSQHNTRVTYRNAAGTATEPDAVAVAAKDPSGNVGAAGITVVSAGTGIRDVTITLDEIGTWYLEITGTGANIVDEITEKRICVTAPSVG